MSVFTFPLAPGAGYPQHTHDDHQLAWAASGVLLVTADNTTWVLPPTRALWLPAGVPHAVHASGRSVMRAPYVAPGRCSVTWTRATPMVASRLLGELITHLEDEGLDPDARARAEAVLVDLLEPVETTTVDAPLPTDERALEVARSLLADPGDQRSLVEWGRAVGASGRTLARVFAADTGVPFGRWRTAARIQAALPMLAAGDAVGRVSRAVGYDTPSAFVAAFRRETGVTPGAYFAD